MASLSELQARANAQQTGNTPNTPDIDMDNTESQSEDPENDSRSDSGLNNDTETTPDRRLTINEVTHLVHRHNLPEGTVADVEGFQQVIFRHCLRFTGLTLF